MGLALCFFALLGATFSAYRGLGHGLGFVLAVGCLYGWLRANFLDGLTHFTFDAALLGLFAATLPRARLPKRYGRHDLTTWILLLLAWPLVVVLLSPMLEAQHIFVQLAGFRNAILFIPVLALGAVLKTRDIEELTSWAEWCVLGVSCFALGETVLGLEEFFPHNSATLNLYVSNDIAGGFYRIPASFVSAHSYGGTLLCLLPLFFRRLEESPRRRWLTIAATGFASLGIFACGARLPVVLFSLLVLGTLLRFRRQPAALLGLVITMAAVGYVIAQSERLQRFETLADEDYVEGRISGSVSMSFVDVLTEFPMGRGLGSAFGTSVPFFLAEYARPPIGIESEYGRLLLEEGLPGLVLWMAFVGWCLGRSATKARAGGAGTSGMWLVCAGTWLSGLIGAGILAAIPGTMMVMLFMGFLISLPARTHAATVGLTRSLRISALARS